MWYNLIFKGKMNCHFQENIKKRREKKTECVKSIKFVDTLH